MKHVQDSTILTEEYLREHIRNAAEWLQDELMQAAPAEVDQLPKQQV